MSTENNKDFQWDEETAKAFAAFYYEQHHSAQISEHWKQELMDRFKKEVGEKRSPEYEILSFRDPCSDAQRRIVTYQSPHLTREDWAQSWLNAKAPIHSVRRLSDGEVFELGKNVQHVDGHYSAVITEFYLPSDERGEMWFYCDGQKDTVKNLNNFTNLPTPKPLFTTEDGVDLFSISDTVYGVCPKGTWETRELGLLLEPNKTNWKWFAIPYNRDRYVLMNKPVLSVNEVMDLIPSDTWLSGEFHERLTSLAKSKL